MGLFIFTLVFNWSVGLLLLALLLRVILRWYDVSLDNRAMLTLLTTTEPVIRPFYRVLPHSGAYVHTPAGNGYLDIAALAAGAALAFARFIVFSVLGLLLNPPLWLFYPQADWGLWLSRLVGLAVQCYTLLILARIIMEWLRISYAQPVMRFLWDITEPLLSPIRRYLPTWQGLDFSAVVAVLLLSLIHMVLSAFLQLIF